MSGIRAELIVPLADMDRYIRCFSTCNSASFTTLQTRQQTVRMVGRVEHAVGVGQQDPGAAAQLEQSVPVLTRAGQPAHLQPEGQPDAVEGDLGQEPLESRPALDRLTALTA